MVLRFAPLLLSVLLGFVVGCSGSNAALEKPETLRDVNRQLQGRIATISLSDGTEISNVRIVEVGEEIAQYQPGKRVSTAAIVRITYRQDSGAGLGFLLGTIPGGIVLSGSLLDTDAPYRDLGIGLGIAVALGGGIVASLLGDVLSPGDEVVAYEAPVDRYIRKQK